MSMCDIIGTLKTWSDTDGAPCAKLQLQCSTTDDLPSIDDVVGGFKVKPGTIAQLVQADTFVTLDYNDTWYPEQEEPEQAQTQTLNASPNLSVNPGSGLRGSLNTTEQPIEEVEEREMKKPYSDLDGEFE